MFDLSEESIADCNIDHTFDTCFPRFDILFSLPFLVVDTFQVLRLRYIREIAEGQEKKRREENEKESRANVRIHEWVRDKGTRETILEMWGREMG